MADKSRSLRAEMALDTLIYAMELAYGALEEPVEKEQLRAAMLIVDKLWIKHSPLATPEQKRMIGEGGGRAK